MFCFSNHSVLFRSRRGHGVPKVGIQGDHFAGFHTNSAVADGRGSKRFALQEANPVSISRLAARAFALLLLLCVGLAIEANLTFAQSSNANLSGTVTDSSGAVVAGAQLTLSNTARKSTSTYQSDDGGRYVFRDLEPGTYSLQVAKTGFQTTMQTGIVLTINASAHNDVVLKVGPGTETVEVLALGVCVDRRIFSTSIFALSHAAHMSPMG